MNYKFKGQSRSFLIIHKQTGKYSVYCKCGYMGSAKQVRVKHDIPLAKPTAPTLNSEGFGVAVAAPTEENDTFSAGNYYTSAEQYCPVCELKPEHTLDERVNYGETCIEFSKVWDNDHKSSLSIFFTEFYYNKEVGKIGAKRKNVRLTHNSNTGMTYLKYGLALRNITYMTRNAIPQSLEPLISMFELKNYHKLDKKLRDRYLEWLEMCFEKRGVRFVNPSEMRDLQSCLAVLKFPVFENLPYRFIGHVPQPIRKALAECKKSNDVYKLIFGTNAKSIRKYFTNHDIAINIRYYQSIFTQTANLQKILCAIDEMDDRKSAYSSNRYLFDESLVEDLTGKYHEASPTLTRIESMEFFKNLHVDETHFTNKILNTLQERTIYPNGYGINAIREKKYMFNFGYVESLIIDIHRIYKQISEYMPEYELNYRGDIKRLHDNIVKDFSKVRRENHVIPYSEKELATFNKRIDDEYEFRLAFDTHQLIDVGSSMDICVGGYGYSAYRRETTIINLLKNGEFHTCLEVTPNYLTNQLTLVQAKINHNLLPDKPLAQMIADYCEEVGVLYKDTYDLQALTSTDAPQLHPVAVMDPDVGVWQQPEQNQLYIGGEDDLPF